MISVRLRPRPLISIVPSLAALLLLITTLWLGQWQLDRARQKDQETLRQTQNQKYQAWTPTDIPSEEADGRLVLAEGKFLPQQSIWWDNQIVRGTPGFKLIVPFQLTSGGVVLVDRGLWAMRGERQEPPLPHISTDTTRIEGIVYLPPQHTMELASQVDEKRIWQNLTPLKFTRVTGQKTYSYLIRESSTPLPGFLRAPNTTASSGNLMMGGMNADRHRGYAFQWYALAGLTIFIWTFFTFFTYESSPTTRDS